MQWTNNVVHSTNASVYHNHEGIDVSLHNNILVGDGPKNGSLAAGVLRSAAPTPPPTNWHAKANITHNILFARASAMFVDAPKDWALSTLDSNVYWAGDGKSVTFPGGLSLLEWQKQGAGPALGGQDKKSVVSDPEFVDANSNIFDLKPGSPALKMGFVPIDLTTIGPRSPK